MAQLDARPTGDQEVAGLTPAEVGNIPLSKFRKFYQVYQVHLIFYAVQKM